MVISEKSAIHVSPESRTSLTIHTLGVQEVVNQHVVAAVGLDGGVLEELLMLRWSDPHVLLAEGSHVIIHAALFL
jgi:hypothetical protein